MNSKRHLVSREDQFRSKELADVTRQLLRLKRRIAKLLQLQKISWEIAKQDGSSGERAVANSITECVNCKIKYDKRLAIEAASSSI